MRERKSEVKVFMDKMVTRRETIISRGNSECTGPIRGRKHGSIKELKIVNVAKGPWVKEDIE